MMSEPKPFASLSSGLLARKGQAKPAMRPQGFADFGMGQPPAAQHDDLGWNDMGHDHGQPSVTQPSAVPQPISDTIVSIPPEAVEPPPVVRQMADLARSLTPAEPVAAAPARVEPEPAELEIAAPFKEAALAATVPPLDIEIAAPVARAPRAAAGSNPKAAFTLRLDPERHLQLRLVCAVRHRSAQAIVLAALDAFLATQPAIAELTRAAAARTTP